MSEKPDIRDLANGIVVQNSQELGSVLAASRADVNLGQGDMAEWLGVSRTYLGELERGADAKRMNRLFSLLEMLGLELVVRRKGLR